MRDEAEEALRLASVSPPDAVELALRLHADALAVNDWASASIAARALGVAALHLGEIADAVRHQRAAVRAARRSSSPQLVGEARTSLAAALAVRGSTTAALREIEVALHDLDGLAAARARTQRAGILQEIGRVDDALKDLRVALPVLRRHGDVRWETGALSNRSALYTSRRAFALAEADLETAAALCQQHDLGFALAYVEQNLGCVKAQRGDVPAALHHFDLAEEHYRRLGVAEGSLLVDRAELLLSVRLVREARETAEEAVLAYLEHERGIHLPEAQLLLASVALAQGDNATATAASEAALDGFRRLKRTSWAALAKYTNLRARGALDHDAITSGQMRRSAEELARAGWTVHALEARVRAGRLAMWEGRSAEAHRDLTEASRARFYGPADVRARAWYAEALLRRQDGRRRAAVAAVTAGLRVVEQHRATLGASELRAHVSLHRGSLVTLGLEMALEDGHPRRVLTWAERGRASAALTRSAHPPEDEVLAHDLADLRTTLGELDEARNDGGPTADLEVRQIGLERKISAHCRQFPAAVGAGVVRVRDADELAASLGEVALVEFVERRDQLAAVTVVDGRSRLRWLGPVRPVVSAMGQVAFALHRLADRRRPPASRAAAGAALDRSTSVLDSLLLRPLSAQLDDRELVLVPSASLQSLPWSVLPSCAGRPVTVSPSATLWSQAHDRRLADSTQVRPETVVVVAGPGLPGARQEAESVHRLHPGGQLLVGERASVSRLATAMDGAALVHIAAHGRLRSDNPQFSALLLADGPYTVYDLERLATAPRHVVLAACDTGRTVTVAGEEILGLTAALLSQGTSTLVAPVVPVPDAETVGLMVAYHANLRAGHSPARALASAQQSSTTDDPVARSAAAGFVCLGDGTAGPATWPPPVRTEDSSVGRHLPVPVGGAVGMRGGGERP